MEGAPLPLHAIVLAAGQGQRFGGGKLHALYRGRPLLSHVLDVVQAARQRGLLDGGHVVVGVSDPGSAALTSSAGLNPILNDAPELGLSHSLQLGLATLTAQTDPEVGAALIFLADQPLVRSDVIEVLVTAWREGREPMIRPRYRSHPEVPGHPVLLARPAWSQARALDGDRGFGSLLNSTVMLDVPGNNPDVDTLADLHALEESS